MRTRGSPSEGPLRTAEFKQLIAAEARGPGDLPTRTDAFFARELDPEGRPSAGIGAARRSRESSARSCAQIGFTRLEPVSPRPPGRVRPRGPVARSASRPTGSRPAEIRGEGVFIQLDEQAVRAWEDRTAVQKARDGAPRRLRRHGPRRSESPAFPGVRFYLLHSLAHLLISAICLECGYAASAIRERIYCAPSDAETADGGDPSLDGNRRHRGHARRPRRAGPRAPSAICGAPSTSGRLCSNDPVCAGHSPKNDHAERFLEGAACHGCLFIAECSCERFNRYLDRALVVPTIGHDPELAFFSERP